jgi:hypothetical protein
LFVERPLNFKLKTLLSGNANAVNELAVKSKMNVLFVAVNNASDNFRA